MFNPIWEINIYILENIYDSFFLLSILLENSEEKSYFGHGQFWIILQ